MRRRFQGAVFAAVLAAGTASLPALGQGIELGRGGPIDVTATDGIEWRQGDQVVIARGSARAIQDGVTIDADRLLARYRQQGAQQGATPATARPSDQPLSGDSEIWRLEAEGRVRISTATDTARGDRAVFDVDQAVLVLTGRDLGLISGPNDITARDSLEYWSQKRMAVARGGAVLVDKAEGRRVTADTLVGYFLEEPPAGGAPQPRVQTAEGRDVPGAGRLDRVEAFGHVEIRTPLDVVRGDRGVYSAATGLARVLGNVRITRGENQINGQEAIVNLRTGVARLVSAPGARVQGLILPNSQDPGGGDPLAAHGQGGRTPQPAPARGTAPR
jgi:lipopolysaccharide export system protein LptA